MKKITRNALYCKLCDEIIESESRHDLQVCSGGHFSVDGGLDYAKRGMMSTATPENMEDRSEFEMVPSEDAKALMHLSESSNNAIAGWFLGIKLTQLRPDIAGRIIAARNEISELSPEIYETGLVLAQADDNLIQAVIDIFEKRTTT